MITTLHRPRASEVGGAFRLEIDVEHAPGTVASGTVSFEVEHAEDAVTDVSVLPLVPAAVVLASRLSQDLQVTEPLPPAVHHGARQVAALLHRWYGMRPAELIAPLAPETSRPRWTRRRRGTGLFFTRGIDSYGALFDLLDQPKPYGPRRRRVPTHLITVDGEVHVDPAVRAGQLADTAAVADRLGIPLITVRTDIRAFIDPHTDWGTETHGSVFAGVGYLLRGILSEVVIAPTHWTPLLRPWGSHPELDPAWSLPELTITHHTGDEPRWARVERVMAEPIAAQSVLVCWQGSGRRNCGRCEKCLRLMTSLEVAGLLDDAADRFEVPFDHERITPGLVVSPHPWCDTIDHLDRAGLRADELRQRWEGAERVGRPEMTFQTRSITPRLPVSGLDAEHVEVLARALAARGLRVDRLRPASPDGPDQLRGSVDDAGRVVVGVLVDGRPRGEIGPVDQVAQDDIDALVRATGGDPATAVAFDPDGQDPPPVAPYPEVRR